VVVAVPLVVVGPAGPTTTNSTATTTFYSVLNPQKIADSHLDRSGSLKSDIVRYYLYAKGAKQVLDPP
jgi:hypothetical protein